jgi:hypothetical protein
MAVQFCQVTQSKWRMQLTWKLTQGIGYQWPLCFRSTGLKCRSIRKALYLEKVYRGFAVHVLQCLVINHINNRNKNSSALLFDSLKQRLQPTTDRTNKISNRMLRRLAKLNSRSRYVLWIWHLVAYIQRGQYAQGFRDRGVRGVFGPKRNDVTGEWRRLHNKNFYALYS